MIITVVIINYNYGRFLRMAIDSALALRWDHKQIIVCDDGSTDDSTAVIKSYGDLIVPIFKPNGGQSDSANTIFRMITGSIVFFLDSDDALLPEAAEEVTRVWTGNVAKVQFPLLTMDEAGVPTGAVYPNYSVERTIKQGSTSYFLSSPTSGNAWAMAFLEKVFPLPTRHGTATLNGAFDGYLSSLATLLGDVVELPRPLARYRINTANAWATRFSVEMIADNCDEDVARTALVHEMAAKLGFGSAIIDLNADDTHMMKRFVYRKYLPERYPFEEGTIRVLYRSLRAVMLSGRSRAKTKGLSACWFLAVAMLPKPLALPIVKMRFVNSYRPAFINRLLLLSGWRRAA